MTFIGFIVLLRFLSVSALEHVGFDTAAKSNQPITGKTGKTGKTSQRRESFFGSPDQLTTEQI